jgi:signal transduction histidine kinase
MQYLEAELNRRGRRELDEVMVSLIQELRTPMTSIVGYTDLLLAETMGILGVKQRDFLQRVKARTEQMETLLAQLVQLATYHDNVPSTNEQVNVQEVIETAVDTVITQLREKNLHLDLDIGHNLPLLPIGRKALHQIMTNLLANACQASTGNGRITLQAHMNTLIPRPSANGHSDKIDFLQLDVTDSGGGILVDDLPRVFDPHHRADDPLIAGLGDTGAGLSVARTLVEANGGRVWVQSQMGQGSTFFVLFPVPTAEPQASEWYGAG